jgi:hypothetical protein
VVSATIEFCERVLKHFIAEGKPETAVVLDRTENDAVTAQLDRTTPVRRDTGIIHGSASGIRGHPLARVTTACIAVE